MPHMSGCHTALQLPGLLPAMDAAVFPVAATPALPGAATPAPAPAVSNFGDAVLLADAPLPADDPARLTCQVAGCGRSLSELKDYHQRYRICDVHIKLPQVVKEGRLQRFCQQCGRFHDLAAFDGARKSCRDQLMKHNQRRRRRTNGEAASQFTEQVMQVRGRQGVTWAASAH